MPEALRVLLSGDVNGKFSTLFNRVAAVNKSNGPFDLLLCTGSFFSQEGGEQEQANSLAELDKYVAGAKQIPVPTYFIGALGPNAERHLQVIDDPASKAEISYLGKAGLRALNGLSVAFLEDEQDTGGVKALEADVGRAEGDIDFLLTCKWPARVTSLCAPGSAPEDLVVAESSAISELALKVRPRYHIAGGSNAFFARVPYVNKDLGAGSHVTRFIGLAAVGNTAKQKSLHALGLQPASKMDAASLQQKPAGTTPCPYAAPQKRPLEEEPPGQAWRWEESKRRKGAEPSRGRPNVVKDARKTIFVRNLPYAATEDDVVGFFSACGSVADFRRGITDGLPLSVGKLHGWALVQFETLEGAERACQLQSANLMGRDLFIDAANRDSSSLPSGAPVQGCWFCLSSEDADLSLVVSVGEEMYIAMDKGPITTGHTLVLPIEHRPNSLELSPPAYSELERYLSALRSCFASQGKELLAFERYLTMKGRGGNHMQFNAVPIPMEAGKRAKEALFAAAKQHNISFKEVSKSQKGEAARAALRDAVGTGEYFLVLLPDGSRFAHAVASAQRHPIGFGRELAAKLAGVPHRADWKACKVGEADEKAMTEAFKATFKSYDIMG